MPGNTRTGSRRSKLVDDISRDKVDIIVSKTKPGIADAISSQLVQLGFFDPLTALGHWRFVEVELETQGDLVEVIGMEANDILDFSVGTIGGRGTKRERVRERERERVNNSTLYTYKHTHNIHVHVQEEAFVSHMHTTSNAHS